MRILFVSNLFPPDIGGPATHISRTAQEMHANGHEVRAVVCCVANSATEDQYPVKRISRHLPVVLRFTLVFFWVFVWSLRADVVYINGLELPATFASRISRTRSLLKVVGDFSWEYAIRHEWTDDSIDDFQNRRYPAKVELVRWVQRAYCRMADELVTPSKYVRELVEGWGVPNHRVHVVNNSLTRSPKLVLPIDTLREELSGDGPIVITVARLYSWKKIDELIRIANQFSRGATLVIVGDGPERKYLECLAEKCANRVVFTGAIDQSEVVSYLAAADVFVLNTRYEGMSHVLLEARWAKTPIVTTSIRGNLEILQHEYNALLVPFGCNKELCRAVNSILENPNRGSALANRAKDGMEHYSWKRQVRETAELLAGSYL